MRACVCDCCCCCYCCCLLLVGFEVALVAGLKSGFWLSFGGGSGSEVCCLRKVVAGVRSEHHNCHAPQAIAAVSKK
ncbi:uncharacterized protein BKA78DRAFT_133597 [Phyllosticta capitalensis]|uniref:uncharacterized protein n=1 Tax=Phyllosticta capitalensis TaxID=121624 RepID=UPI00312D8159